MAVIAIDLGGTKLASAMFTRQGRPLRQGIVALGGRRGRAVGRLIGEQVRRLLQVARERQDEVSAIGVSVPGISRVQSGTVWAPNIPGWQDYPLRAELESIVGESGSLCRSGNRRIPLRIDSDRACAILGETWRGAAKGCQNAIFLAVGTGIGAGILIEGQVLRGTHDIAGAIGWWALDRPFRAEYIACGCFEHHASGNGLAKVANELLAALPRRNARVPRPSHSPSLTAREVFAAAERRDPVARQVLAQAIEFWGMAVANLVSLFNPEVILFGGGVFGPAARLLPQIRREARKWAQPVAIRQVELLPSKLGGEAALYGAARLALTETLTTER